SDHLRGEARRGEILREAQALLEGGADWRTPEREVIARDELQRLRRAVAALPELSRRIVHLNRFEGRTHREIAAQLGISVTTVENHVRKVLERL
ncbi:sigma-70 family RNA polymerase sigma factor, partial [Acinetobacter baumannii]